MDKHNFPPLEPENSLPESFPEIPEQMAPLEDVPVIEELTFEAAPPLPEPDTSEEEPTEESAVEETVPAAEEPIPQENAPLPKALLMSAL